VPILKHHEIKRSSLIKSVFNSELVFGNGFFSKQLKSQKVGLSNPEAQG
jgi:hypothetical protein